MKERLIKMISFYQRRISPLFPPRCRFYPTCSQYAKDAIVDTIELDEVRAQEAIENVKKIGVDNNINIMVGNAVDILPTLNGEYDLVFIDAAKSKYSIFLSEGIRLIRNGGIILADNVLYKVVPVGIIKTGKGWGKTLQ